METRRQLCPSPSRSTKQEASVVLSSSPEFPSIDDLLPKTQKKPLLRTGSRAAPIPETAFKSFTTASHFWQSTIAEEEQFAGTNEGVKSQQAGAQPRKESVLVHVDDALSPSKTFQTSPPSVEQGACTTAETIAPQLPVKVKRRAKPRPKPLPTVEIEESLASSPNDKPWKKYKGKEPTDGQTKINKGKVTKPSAAKPKQPKKKAEIVSNHFAPPVAPEPIELEDDPIDLEPALRRRTDWTPTKNTEPPVILLDPCVVDVVASSKPSGADSSLPPRTNIFKSLRETYSCPEMETLGRPVISLDEPGDVLGKRKLIEMVTTSKTARSKTPEASPIRQKAPKKKPRTITELATAAYRVVEVDDNLVADGASKEDSVLNYFTPSEAQGPVQTTVDQAVVCKGKTSKPAAKSKPKRASKRKAGPLQPILLSPESAIRQVSRQDFVFGTSSQLATEVDSGLLRDLQQAMKDSNRQDDFTFFDSSPVTSKVVAKSSGRRLWGAGARDEDGDLLEVEVIDLVDSPAIEKDLTNPAVILSLSVDAVDTSGSRLANSGSCTAWNEVDVVTISSSLTSSVHAIPQLPVPGDRTMASGEVPMVAAASSSALHQSITRPVELDDDPPASNQEQYQQMTSSTPPVAPPPDLPEVPAPKYDLYTDAQLAKAMQSYGFKPIKRRTAAIALLQQCWSSKQQNKVQSIGQSTTANMSTSSTPAAKAPPIASAPAIVKLRGRPKKTAPVVETSEAISLGAKQPRGKAKKDAAPIKPVVATTTSNPSTPKRKRKAPTQPPIEIADSDASDTDNPFASSPASPAATNEFSSPVPGVELSMITEADDDGTVLLLTSSPTGQQARLFRFITNAVKTAPRSRDPAEPSWHEKMLMYDPIVIEDLTAWLNGGQLDRVGCEDEVGTADVKKWCESKSVCCLWRVNINGKERKRF
jgi:hypothetical protein